MAFDRQDFFREVTIRICGSLDINEALYETYLYLKQHFFVDEVRLSRPDIEVGAIQLLARASDRESKE